MKAPVGLDREATEASVIYSPGTSTHNTKGFFGYNLGRMHAHQQPYTKSVQNIVRENNNSLDNPTNRGAQKRTEVVIIEMRSEFWKLLSTNTSMNKQQI